MIYFFTLHFDFSYQVSELQEQLTRTRDQKTSLENELDTQTAETQKQVM